MQGLHALDGWWLHLMSSGCPSATMLPEASWEQGPHLFNLTCLEPRQHHVHVEMKWFQYWSWFPSPKLLQKLLTFNRQVLQCHQNTQSAFGLTLRYLGRFWMRPSQARDPVPQDVPGAFQRARRERRTQRGFRVFCPPDDFSASWGSQITGSWLQLDSDHFQNIWQKKICSYSASQRLQCSQILTFGEAVA